MVTTRRKAYIPNLVGEGVNESRPRENPLDPTTSQVQCEPALWHACQLRPRQPGFRTSPYSAFVGCDLRRFHNGFWQCAGFSTRNSKSHPCCFKDHLRRVLG